MASNDKRATQVAEQARTTEPAAAAPSMTDGLTDAAPTDAGGRDRPARRDQTVKCPGCGGYQCPASNGVRTRPEGKGQVIVSYRECADCGRRFVTKRREGSEREDLEG